MSDSYQDWGSPKIVYSESAGMAATQALRDYYKAEAERYKAECNRQAQLIDQLQADLDRWELDHLKRNGAL